MSDRCVMEQGSQIIINEGGNTNLVPHLPDLHLAMSSITVQCSKLHNEASVAIILISQMNQLTLEG